MGIIIKKLKVRGDKGEKMVNCLFDTGASISFVRKDCQEGIASAYPLIEPMSFSLGDGKGKLKAMGWVHIEVEVNGCKIFDEALIVDSLAEDMIIGASTMQKYRIKLDLEHDEIILDKKQLELMLV